MITKQAIILVSIYLMTISMGIAQQNDLKKVFHFGSLNTNKSGTKINKAIIYNEETGYGFDFQSNENVTINKQSLTGKNSIYFSILLPEGNYKIAVILGGEKSGITTIKAESRRLMLKEIKTPEGKLFEKEFTVNLRTPKITDNKSIIVKDRDKNQLNWDNKLTLEFSGTPVINSIEIIPISQVKTLFLAGDSTVTDQDQEPWASWGQFITNYFSDQVVIANYAESGATLSSFKASNRLDKVLTLMKSGDYVFIEFGHNDEKIKGEGNGAWGLYTNSLKEFIAKFREKGAIPVLVTPTERRGFNKDGTLKASHGDFPDAMREVARELQVPLIDITKMTTDMYESWGNEPSKKAFVHYPANTFPRQPYTLEDNTHFNSFGANEIAKGVVQGIRDLNLEIANYIKPNTPIYNPKNPDNFSNWTLPISIRFGNKKPDGN